MKWITRSHVRVDRVACPWLITRFIDSDAEFLFVPESKVMEIAEKTGSMWPGTNKGNPPWHSANA